MGFLPQVEMRKRTVTGDLVLTVSARHVGQWGVAADPVCGKVREECSWMPPVPTFRIMLTTSAVNLIERQ